jgi:hypothetical protein
MRYTNISFDLETLGVDPGCVITQIGACAFHACPLDTCTYQCSIDGRGRKVAHS